MVTREDREREIQKALGHIVEAAVAGGMSAGVPDEAVPALLGSVALSLAMAVSVFPEWGEQLIREGMEDNPEDRKETLRRLWVNKVPL